MQGFTRPGHSLKSRTIVLFAAAAAVLLSLPLAACASTPNTARHRDADLDATNSAKNSYRYSPETWSSITDAQEAGVQFEGEAGVKAFIRIPGDAFGIDVVNGVMGGSTNMTASEVKLYASEPVEMPDGTFVFPPIAEAKNFQSNGADVRLAEAERLKQFVEYTKVFTPAQIEHARQETERLKAAGDIAGAILDAALRVAFPVP